MSANHPYISICIPAYKRVNDLSRLFDSIVIQSFPDFEVIVTDDTPDDSVSQLCTLYQNKFTLYYFRNTHQLGTPENWNEAIRKAKGEWIKLMHDDDWFSSGRSLDIFYNESLKHPECSFIFCAYQNFHDGKVIFGRTLTHSQERLLQHDPQDLISKNLIGPPSVVMHKTDRNIVYDRKMKWMVDIDYYIRYLLYKPGFRYLSEFLVNVGLNESQVTQQVIKDPKIVLPENLRVFNKLHPSIFKKIRNYDYGWRLVRNYGIRTEKDASELLRLHPITEKIPSPVLQMIRSQRYLPESLLKIGVLSKLCMFYSFVVYRITGN